MVFKNLLKTFIYIFIITIFLLLIKKIGLFNQKIFIVETDAGYDDILALIYLLKSPINIEAISIVNGITSVDKGYDIVKKVLSLNHRSDIPVIKGESNPLRFPVKFCGKKIIF